MAKVKQIEPIQCLKCGETHPKMMQVGPMIFCGVCFKIEFNKNFDATGVDSKSKTYRYWIKKYSEK